MRFTVTGRNSTCRDNTPKGTFVQSRKGPERAPASSQVQLGVAARPQAADRKREIPRLISRQ